MLALLLLRVRVKISVECIYNNIGVNRIRFSVRVRVVHNMTRNIFRV